MIRESFASDDDELTSLLDSLEREGYVNTSVNSVSISANGYEYLEKTSRPQSTSPICITIDDIESFVKVKQIEPQTVNTLLTRGWIALAESEVKAAISEILQESFVQQDRSTEFNDISMKGCRSQPLFRSSPGKPPAARREWARKPLVAAVPRMPRGPVTRTSVLSCSLILLSSSLADLSILSQQKNNNVLLGRPNYKTAWFASGERAHMLVWLARFGRVSSPASLLPGLGGLFSWYGTFFVSNRCDSSRSSLATATLAF